MPTKKKNLEDQPKKTHSGADYAQKGGFAGQGGKETPNDPPKSNQDNMKYRGQGPGTSSEGDTRNT